MNKPAEHHWLPAERGWKLVLAGDWRGARAAALTDPPAELEHGPLVIEAADLQSWDGALTAALRSRLAPLARAGVLLDLQTLPEGVRAVLRLALPASGSVDPVRQTLRIGLIARLGAQLQQAGTEALRTAAFVGEVLLALLRLLRGRSGMRAVEWLRQIDMTGPLSIPIVSLTCFLMGLILAYMGGAQLDRIGAQTFIPSLVTVGMVRELAGLMTGIILSGRVGAAFAAQLATMKAGEEIDALRVLGVDPIDELVLPRVLALMLVAPFLIAFAAVVGMVAGLIASIGAYGLPVSEYVQQSLRAITWTHLLIGLFKGTLYAALVAVAGLPRRTQRGARCASGRRSHHPGCRQVAGVDRGRRLRHDGGVPELRALDEPPPKRLRRSASRGRRPAARQSRFRGRHSTTSVTSVARGVADRGTAAMTGNGGADVLVRAHGLTVARSGIVVQQGLDFEVLRGEVFVVIGASGSGKSSLLRHLIGLKPPLFGRIELEGQNLYQGSDAELRALRRRFGVMFQAGALWSAMSIGENLMLPLRLFTRLSRRARREQALLKLALVGLEGAFDVMPADLSGGMRKRAALARALVLDPQLLFLDEPASGLDPVNAARLDALILQLREHLGTTVVMVTHEIDSVFAVADRALFLDQESKTMTGLDTPRALLEQGAPRVREFLRHRPAR